MPANCYTRYGATMAVDLRNVEQVMAQLPDELRAERFDEPDDEHTQVSIENAHWAITAQDSGLVTFDNMDLAVGRQSDLPERMYVRDVPDDDLKAIWRATVSADRLVLLAQSWSTLQQLPPFKSNYYRYAP